MHGLTGVSRSYLILTQLKKSTLLERERSAVTLGSGIDLFSMLLIASSNYSLLRIHHICIGMS